MLGRARSSFVMNPRINPSLIAYLSQPLQPHYATLRVLCLIFLPRPAVTSLSGAFVSGERLLRESRFIEIEIFPSQAIHDSRECINDACVDKSSLPMAGHRSSMNIPRGCISAIVD
jgi:hypothetical protein